MCPTSDRRPAVRLVLLWQVSDLFRQLARAKLWWSIHTEERDR